MSVSVRRLAPAADAALGGALYFLGYVGWGCWPLILVFLVPLWRALERARGPGAAVGLGLVFGATAYAGGYPWLWPLVKVFLADRLALGAALWTLHGLWFAAGFGVYGLAFHALRRRGAPVALAGIAPLLLVEWLQPQLFPVNAGAALVDVTPLVQIADLGGPLLLSALVGAINAAAHAGWCWLRGERGAPVLAWSAAATLVVAALLYGQLRIAGIEAAGRDLPALRVGIVQANLGVLEKRTRLVQGHRLHLAQTRELLAEGPVDLVVWPETAYGHGLRRPLPLDGQPVRGDLDVPLLFGGSSVWEEQGRRVSANSALLVGADGVIRDAYDKNLLIPLAERLPLAGWLPSLAAWFPHLQDFRASHEVPVLHLGDVRIATPICYEVIVAPFVRRMVREARPQLLVTLANDAWFGDSQEPWIHLALARLRAVEHRLWLVRATNSGISAVVDPTGRVVARTGLGTRENLRAEVRPRDPATLYARFGDWPGPLALLVALAAIARRRRSPMCGEGP
jgi:apolipoprotein N-acyltransferase